MVAVTAVGMIVGALPHLAAGRPAGMAGMASRLLAVAFVAMAFRPIAGLPVLSQQVWLRLAVMLVLIVAGWFAECVIRALIRADALRARFGVSLGDELQIQIPLGAAVGASAMLIALAAEAMGLVALALLIAPLLVTQTAFRRYAGIRSTYLQTVRALARVTEVGGYVEDGHSRRVSRLAVAVGRELGMSEPDLLQLEYAALMHDIGQLSLADPIPGGATVLASPQDQQRIAGLGAERHRAGGRAGRGGGDRPLPEPALAGPGPGAADRQPDHPRRQRLRRPGRRLGRPGPVHRRPWNGSGWTPPRSTTPASWRRSPRWPDGTTPAACRLPPCLIPRA